MGYFCSYVVFLDNLNIFAVGLIKLQIPYHRQDQVSCVAGILNNPSIFS